MPHTASVHLSQFPWLLIQPDLKKKTWSQTQGCPWGLIPSFHLLLLLTSFSKITYRIFKSYAVTTSSPRHTEQSATPVPTKQMREQSKGRNPIKKPLSYLDTVDDELVSSEDLLQDSTPGVESSCTGITTSCEHWHNDTAEPDVSSHMRTAHTSSKMYLKPAPRGSTFTPQTNQIIFILLTPACFWVVFFETLYWFKPEVPTHTPEFHSTHASSIYFCSSLPQLFPSQNMPQ